MGALGHSGQGAEELQDWGTGGRDSPSLHTHAYTCLKHIGHTRAVVLKWAGNYLFLSLKDKMLT